MKSLETKVLKVRLRGNKKWGRRGFTGKIRSYMKAKNSLGARPELSDAAARCNRAMNYAIYISILGNVVLFAAKYVVGILTESVAIKADAWHTLSDVLTSIIVIVGYRVARKPADREHPFGHGRYELISTMLVGVFLFGVAGMFLYEGTMQLVSRTQVAFGPLAIAVTVLSIVVKEGMAQYTMHVAKKINNPALRADSWHHRSDALSSLVVLVGILVGKWFWWMDGVLAIAVAVLIAVVAVKTFRSVSSAILGEAPSKALTESVARVVNETYPSLELQPHNFRWHNYIQHQEITLHIVLPDDFTVRRSFDIAAHLERRIYEELNIEATIRVQPFPSHHEGTARASQGAEEE